jgi:teichuronic acid biosynthesis glycosyltransferase TuaC
MPQAGAGVSAPLRVLWPHNFNPEILNGQVFLNTAAAGLRARGVDLHLEFLGNLRSIPNLLRARRRVREISADFDVVHSQYGSACALATAAVDSAPTVLTVRGNDWNVHQGSLNFHYFHTRLARAMTRMAIGSFDAVLGVSRRMSAELARFAPDAYLDTLPSPIDLEKFVPMDRAQARAQLGEPASDEKWVLFNSLRLHDPVKRYRLAKQAFDTANARRGDLRLRIANDLPHAMLPVFAAACDVILCTSETEGWPNSVKEALACNVRFVSTDVSDLRDIAAREPSCRVCAPSALALADGLCAALDAGGTPDLRRYVQDMSLDAGSDRLIQIYETLMARRRGVLDVPVRNKVG